MSVGVRVDVHVGGRGRGCGRLCGRVMMRVVGDDADEVMMSSKKQVRRPHKGLCGAQRSMAWALWELQLHQQAKRQGVPRAAMN